MAFRDQIAFIPYTPAGAQATGLLAPIIRAMGHILFACAEMADPNRQLTAEELKNELDHAAGHLTTTLEQVHRAPLSQRGKDLILHWVEAVHNARDEHAGWDGDETINNLKDLANRAAALAAFLDEECVGLHGSNPGSAL